MQNFSWVTVIQYDNISKNLGFNSRIHWTKRAGENVYVVFTNNYLELDEIASTIGTDKKIAIGVISHRTLQVETPEEVAGDIRRALKLIPPERLIISSDCGFGRQGISRKHAFYKMVSLVKGTNMVREELGLEQKPVLAALDNLKLL